MNGTKIAKGSVVRLHPKRRADVWDMFLDNKLATVRAIHQDVEDQLYVAVTVDDDPASDLHEWYGRSFFFYPDEVEPARHGPGALGMKVLVAGIGNIFFGDDGFGPAVARALSADSLSRSKNRGLRNSRPSLGL